ncbi:small ubiquitin-related modifier [Nematocida displodere]|uniref:Small ubiquitin-related modifier n=1 Tax=Nematocida displodere TaxID=1805483 RepID=A0A177EIM5_9MICR|nr:small ubiquitin-related modifier [Nematocida displodere]
MDTEQEITHQEETAPQTHVQIKVDDQMGSTWSFKLKKHTSMGKVFSEYAKRVYGAGSVNKLRFIYNGRTITAEDTPDALDLKDGAHIEVFSSQVGG